MRKFRDLSLIDLGDGRVLVIACDSCGGVGPKENDVVRTSGYVVGRFTSRVALMEVLCCGAWPICVVNTLCVEPSPTGARIIEGIADELSVIGVAPEKVLTGSTEKNLPTSQTGVGVTVIGMCREDDLRLGRLAGGEVLGLVGVPKVGEEVTLEDPEIADLSTVRLLLSEKEIKEMVPVGSRGIRAEAEMLAQLNDLRLVWYDLKALEGQVDLYKSAGPATCVLVAGEERAVRRLEEKTEKPFTLLGRLLP